MDEAQLQSLIQSYKHYETRFFHCHHNQDAQQDGFLYGEVGFCLAGLKPAVLIDFPTPLLDHYMTAVMTPWLTRWNDGGVLGMEWRVVQRHLTSPELAHGMPVVFLVHTTDPRLAASLLGRQLLLDDNEQQLDVRHEDDLALLLDYPGRLPHSLDDLDTMREVVYYDQLARLVLTTFAAQLDQQLNVQRHFDAYKTAMATLGVHLGLIFRRPTA